MYLTEEQNEFFLQNEGLVFYLANEFNKKYFGFSIPELVALAGVGVMKATKYFKPESGYKFATFASTCAENEVRMALRTKQKFNRLEACSIDDTVHAKDDSLTIGDMLNDSKVDVEEEVLRNEQFNIIYRYIDTLPERERLVFMFHHGLKGYPHKTQSELAKLFGISQSYIARIRLEVEEGLRKYAKAANSWESNKTKGSKKPRRRYTDHLGVEFDHLPTMLKYHGVTRALYYERKKQGLTLEECLTPQVKNKRGNNTKAVKDHLGNEFDSVQAMLKHYNVGKGFYYSRSAKGMSLEDCLVDKPKETRTNSKPKKVFKDHLDNAFDSISKMLKHYSIKPTLYYRRKNAGLSLEECLAPKSRNKSSKRRVNDTKVTDHLGNIYDSVSSMLKQYNVSRNVYYRIKKKGYPLEVCLGVACPVKNPKSIKTSRGKSTKPCEDHLGNKFTSVKAMLHHHGVKPYVYQARRRLGLSLEECLSSERQKRKTGDNGRILACEDHLGNKFESITAMLKHYGVCNSLYYRRKKQGLSLEECLGKPTDKTKIKRNSTNGNKKVCFDHNGKEFNSVTAMLEYHGVDKNTYYKRKIKGFSLEVCLSPVDTIIPNDRKRSRPCKDHNGKEFNSVTEMVNYHGTTLSVYYARKSKGYSLESCLNSDPPKYQDLKEEHMQNQTNQENETTQEVLKFTNTSENNTPKNKPQSIITSNDTEHRILNLVYEDTSARVLYLDETTNTVQTRYISYDSPVWYSSETTSIGKSIRIRGTDVIRVCV